MVYITFEDILKIFALKLGISKDFKYGFVSMICSDFISKSVETEWEDLFRFYFEYEEIFKDGLKDFERVAEELRLTGKNKYNRRDKLFETIGDLIFQSMEASGGLKRFVDTMSEIAVATSEVCKLEEEERQLKLRIDTLNKKIVGMFESNAPKMA